MRKREEQCHWFLNATFITFRVNIGVFVDNHECAALNVTVLVRTIQCYRLLSYVNT